jgi:hypothetical protein
MCESRRVESAKVFTYVLVSVGQGVCRAIVTIDTVGRHLDFVQM